MRAGRDASRSGAGRDVVQKDDWARRQGRPELWGAANRFARCRPDLRPIAADAWAGRGAVRSGANCRESCRERDHGCRSAGGHDYLREVEALRARPDALSRCREQQPQGGDRIARQKRAQPDALAARQADRGAKVSAERDARRVALVRPGELRPAAALAELRVEQGARPGRADAAARRQEPRVRKTARLRADAATLEQQQAMLRAPQIARAIRMETERRLERNWPVATPGCRLVRAAG